MSAEHWDLDQDNTMGGDDPSPNKAPSQKAVNEFVKSQGGGSSIDVQINGESIVDNDVANIPLSGTNVLGVSKANAAYGVYNNAGTLTISKATDTQIQAKQSQYRPLVPYNIDLVVKTGLTTNTISLTDVEKLAICNWIGSAMKVNNVSPDENGNITLTIPAAVTESTVSGWGFTKNAGTITGIKMNGSSKGTSGVVDLGTVLTQHQDISGKQNKISIIYGV